MDQTSLFEMAAPDLAVVAAKPEKWDRPDTMSMAARNRYGLGATWRWIQSEVVDMKVKNSDFMLHMADAATVGVFKSGPRKGETKWPELKDCRRVIISRADLDSAEAGWEQEHGVCVDCGGVGTDALASAQRACRRCKGSGKPKAAL